MNTEACLAMMLELFCMGNKDSFYRIQLWTFSNKKTKWKVKDYNLLSMSGFQCLNVTLKECQISTLNHFNKIECLFNVDFRRCFNLYLPAESVEGPSTRPQVLSMITGPHFGRRRRLIKN